MREEDLEIFLCIEEELTQTATDNFDDGARFLARWLGSNGMIDRRLEMYVLRLSDEGSMERDANSSREDWSKRQESLARICERMGIDGAGKHPDAGGDHDQPEV